MRDISGDLFPKPSWDLIELPPETSPFARIGLKVLLRQLDDFGGLGELELARWTLFRSRPQKNFLVFHEDNLETAAFRLPSRIQSELDCSELLAQRVANGDSIALEHGSGGAV